MIENFDVLYDWSPESMLEVILPTPDAFLKIKETLTRIGIASKKSKTLYQSCLLLHKRGRYFIVHFKELFALDGRDSSITQSDIDRRNYIAYLLQDWGLLKLAKPDLEISKAALSTMKIISFKEKNDWELVEKYQLGKKRNLEVMYMNETETMLTLELPVASVNKILQVLGNSPFVEVANLIAVIKRQGEVQLAQMSQAEEGVSVEE